MGTCVRAEGMRGCARPCPATLTPPRAPHPPCLAPSPVGKITGKEGLLFQGSALCFDCEEDMLAALEKDSSSFKARALLPPPGCLGWVLLGWADGLAPTTCCPARVASHPAHTLGCPSLCSPHPPSPPPPAPDPAPLRPPPMRARRARWL